MQSVLPAVRTVVRADGRSAKKRGSDAEGNPRSSGTAEVAVFGTLSETCRTCGRAAIVSRGGPNHGPHLNVSYLAEKGKTTGYYVPQAAAEATRQGAWQKLQECLRELGEFNQGEEFAAGSRGGFAMKRWWGWVLLLLRVAGLLFSLESKLI